MKKVFLFIAMVTVSVVTWAQDNGVYRAIEGEQFKEYIDELTKYLFGGRLVLWDDVVDEEKENTMWSDPVTRETIYYDQRNGLIIKVIRKSSEEVEKDFKSDLKRILPNSLLYSQLNKGDLREKACDKWEKMKCFHFVKAEDVPYDLDLCGLTKKRESFQLIYREF